MARIAIKENGAMVSEVPGSLASGFMNKRATTSFRNRNCLSEGYMLFRLTTSHPMQWIHKSSHYSERGHGKNGPYGKDGSHGKNGSEEEGTAVAPAPKKRILMLVHPGALVDLAGDYFIEYTEYGPVLFSVSDNVIKELDPTLLSLETFIPVNSRGARAYDASKFFQDRLFSSVHIADGTSSLTLFEKTYKPGYEEYYFLLNPGSTALAQITKIVSETIFGAISFTRILKDQAKGIQSNGGFVFSSQQMFGFNKKMILAKGLYPKMHEFYRVENNTERELADYYEITIKRNERKIIIR